MELLWNKAEKPSALLVFAHGAGAAMDSDFMERMTALLCEQGISVVRFEFPYMQERRTTGKKRPPDRQPVLLEAWSLALHSVKSQTELPVYIGGKSMGGRMATLLATDEVFAATTKVEGIFCLGYPFYAMGKQDKPRTAHLETIKTPTLILQGERDTMGNRKSVESYRLSDPIQVAWLEDGNHDLKPRKASGFTHDQHMGKAARLIKEFIG